MDVKEEKTDVGVIIGRFQVDDLHPAHKDLIETVMSRHKKTIIFLGLSPLKCTTNNPLDFEARKQMITFIYPSVTVLYIKDMVTDTVWSKKLDEQISDITGPNQSVTLYGGRESFIDHYKGRHNCIELEETQNSFLSGTAIRKSISKEVKSDPMFRRGVIWASNNMYVNALPTVDVAIWNEDKTKLLMARKPYETQYRFIGGFVEAGHTLEETVRKEVSEEAHIEISDPEFVCSAVIDDWRYRSEKVKITSSLFQCKYVFGKPTPDDDIEELKWIDIGLILANMANIVPNHRDMMSRLLSMMVLPV